MPEAPELRLTAEFINRATRMTTVRLINKSEISKNPNISIDCCNAPLYAEANGKELILTIYGQTNTIFLKMTMGMSGYFKLTENWVEYPKHSHLRFHLDNGQVLSFIDPRRFGKWKIVEEKWLSSNRGPTIFDSVRFQHHFFDHFNEKKVQDAYLLDIIMNQKLFNGVGNYLRAEIFDRCNINPFRQVKELSSTEIIKLLKTCTSVAEESYKLGGGQLKDWKNPFGQDHAEFRKWLQTYGKELSIKDKTGRKFWFNSKHKQTEEYAKYCESRRRINN